MKISVVLSIILHIAILYTYPTLNPGVRRERQEKVKVSFLEIAGEDFSVIGAKLPDRESSRLNLLKNSKVWEVSWPVIDIQVLPEPEDISSFLGSGSKELPGIEIYEKESPPLTEELEDSDRK